MILIKDGFPHLALRAISYGSHESPPWFRFLGRHARRLCDADRCLASEKRSSGKSRGWSWWIVCCYGDCRGASAFTLICQTR
jgi:hypothetical protein